LATCLSQLYHDGRAGVQSGYAKFETFPVWNLPLRHPLNLAYEAATADIGDINLIDPFHLEAYGQTAVNYNRDIEVFPVVERILEKVTGQKNVYKSPTDMGVNCIGFAIVNDKVVQEASKQEIIRRFFRYSGEYARGLGNEEAVEKTKSLLVELNIRPEMRRVVEPARQAAAEAKAKGKGNKGVYVGAALELSDGTLMTGKNSELLHASSSLFINTVKFLAAIPDETHLLSPRLIASLGQLKENIFGEKNISLDLEETLIALSIDAATNPITARALAQIGQLQGCEVHLTHLSKAGDENTWRKLGVNLTSDAVFPSPNLSEL
jgi:uncharacterized protein (UPF0371 family)